VIRGDLSGTYGNKSALCGTYGLHHVDEVRVVFAFDIELDPGVVVGKVLSHDRDIVKTYMSLITPRVDGDAVASSSQTRVDGVEEVGVVAASRVSQQGVFVYVNRQ